MTVTHAAALGRAGRVTRRGRRARRPGRDATEVTVPSASPATDAAVRLGAERAGRRREFLTLSTVATNVLCAVSTISETVWDAADTTPRVPSAVAVRAAAPMFATPDTALVTTSRAI